MTIARLSAERGRLHDIIRSLRIGGQPANRIEPLEEHQIKVCACTISQSLPASITSTAFTVVLTSYGRKGALASALTWSRFNWQRERALTGAKSRGDVAQAWVTHYEQTLGGIRRALAVDEDPVSPDGALVRPFAGGKRR